MSRLFIFVFVVLSLFPTRSLAKRTTSSRLESPLETAFALPLVTRTGRPSCWASWNIPDGRICVPKDLWDRDFSASGDWLGRWSLSSPLDESGTQKIILRTFHADQKLPDPSVSTLLQGITQWIEQRREELSRSLSDSVSDEFGVQHHLLLNEQKEGDSSSFLRMLGFVHLFSASGVHLVALSLGVGFILKKMSIFFELPLGFMLPFSRICSAALWLWGWLLSGLRPSLLRPILLLGLRGLSRRLGFRWKPWAPLALAIVLDLFFSTAGLLIRHEALSDLDWDQGRVFYMLAIGGSALAERNFELGLASWFGVAIWEGLKTGVIAAFTPLFSLLTLSLYTLFIYPALVLISIVGRATLFAPLFYLSDHFLSLCIHLAMLPGNLWAISKTSFFCALLGGVGVIVFPKGFRLFAAATLSICFIVTRVINPFAAPISVTQIDVGQGDGALVQEPCEGLQGLIDTGSKKSLSDSQWISFLASRGIAKINWIGLTHLDEDHSGGALRLARLIKIDCLATSNAELSSNRGVAYEKELRAMDIRVDHRLSSCDPYPSYEPPEHPPRAHEANENMSAFYIPLGKRGFYLSAGDATEKEEIPIGVWASEQENFDQARTRILKISHHGSKTSSNPEFLNTIRPTEAWISDGVGNHYGHPAPVILRRLDEMKMTVLRTDEKGALTVTGEKN